MAFYVLLLSVVRANEIFISSPMTIKHESRLYMLDYSGLDALANDLEKKENPLLKLLKPKIAKLKFHRNLSYSFFGASLLFIGAAFVSMVPNLYESIPISSQSLALAGIFSGFSLGFFVTGVVYIPRRSDFLSLFNEVNDQIPEKEQRFDVSLNFSLGGAKSVKNELSNGLGVSLEGQWFF